MRKKFRFRPQITRLRYGINEGRVITLEAWVGRCSRTGALARITRQICALHGLAHRETYRVVYALLGTYHGIQGAHLTEEGGIAGYYDFGNAQGVHEAHLRLAQGGPLLAAPVRYDAAHWDRCEARTRYVRRVPYRRPATNLPF